MDFNPAIHDDKDYWPCACTKRGKDGLLSKIKLNHKTVKKCRQCGCERPEGMKSK